MLVVIEDAFVLVAGCHVQTHIVHDPDILSCVDRL